MGVTPRRVHDQAAWVRADGLGKCLGTVVDNNVAPADLAWESCVGEDLGVVRVVAALELRDLDLRLETRFSLMDRRR